MGNSSVLKSYMLPSCDKNKKYKTKRKQTKKNIYLNYKREILLKNKQNKKQKTNPSP